MGKGRNKVKTVTQIEREEIKVLFFLRSTFYKFIKDIFPPSANFVAYIQNYFLSYSFVLKFTVFLLENQKI